MKKKLFVTLIVIMAMLYSTIYSTDAYAKGYKLDDEQLEIAEEIEKICTERWEECGVLPSVCIAQAYIESHVGKVCYANNLWGLHGGYRSYESLDDGINAYINCINNGYYDKALWHTDPEYVINAIYDGGYCTTDRSTYVGGVLWVIDEFDLQKYDAIILKNCYMKTSNVCETWKHIE